MPRHIFFICTLVAMLALPCAALAEQKWGEMPSPSSATELGSLESRSSPRISEAGDWQLLAARMAEQVKAIIAYRPDLMGKKVYVQSGNNRPFGASMTNLVTSELVSRGINVTLMPDGNNLLLECNPSLIPPRAGREEDDRELLITFSLWNGNTQILHNTSIYSVRYDDIETYVNPNDHNYAVPEFPSRGVRLTAQ